MLCTPALPITSASTGRTFRKSFCSSWRAANGLRKAVRRQRHIMGPWPLSGSRPAVPNTFAKPTYVDTSVRVVALEKSWNIGADSTFLLAGNWLRIGFDHNWEILYPKCSVLALGATSISSGNCSIFARRSRAAVRNDDSRELFPYVFQK